MSADRPPLSVAIIGAGRAGRALALALVRAAIPVRVCTRRSGAPIAAGLECTPEPWADVLAGADVVLLAVPDSAIGDVARHLAPTGLPKAVVLHCSGVLDRSVLAPLEGRARGLGSFHPLQTLAGDTDAAERLQAAFVALEGDAAAVAAGRELAGLLQMRPIEVDAARKPLYHAGAVIMANYTVVLAALAERVARAAGIPADAAGRIYLPLLEGTLRNLEALGPVSALTGPIQRGDATTVQRHLAALDPGSRALYRVLGREALELARAGGLEEHKAQAVAALLEGGGGP